MVIGIYAGSFDPFTSGHLDIVKRSMALVDQLIIAIGSNTAKKSVFGNIERGKMIHLAIDAELDFLMGTNIKVQQFDGLLVEHARKMGATVLIRGVRTNADFEYETSLANINKKLAPEIDTVFLPTRLELSIVSSSVVRELMIHKSDYSQFVPKSVYDYIQSTLTKAVAP
jgi:pantetheine-phosphate adenylyltransferase